MNVVTDERCAGYAAPGHPERPSRITATLARLRNQQALPLSWSAPLPVHEETLLRAHTPGHLHHVLSATEEFDPDTPWLPDIAEHAWRAAGGALGAMQAGLEGRKVLSQALRDLAAFQPDLVAVSAGFDAYVNDPLAQETSETEDFHWLGQQVRKLDLPTFNVLEGGYSDELPDLILAYLCGLGGQ